MKRALLVALGSVFLSACSCGGAVQVGCQTNAECGNNQVCTGGNCVGGGTCTTNAQCTNGQTCTNGSCVGGVGGGAGGGSGAGNGGSGGSGGGNTVVTGCNPSATDNAMRDTDCDGLNDAEEYNTLYANNNKTDPCDSDSDKDGIPDGVEMGRIATVNAACGAKFVPDSDPITRSDPTNTDSDGDGIKDGAEDKNHDGKLDPGECSAIRKDTDCDGISDFDEVKGTLGCATDCAKADTDGDGLPDGVEQGLAQPGSDPVVCKYPAATFDSDVATKTMACTADTDGDGIEDGAEDGDHDGKVDPGELNPNVADTALPDGGSGPATAACATANLRPIVLQSAGFPDVQVALVPTFTEVSRLTETGEKGIIFYDPTSHIAGLVLSKTPQGADAAAEEALGRTKIGGTSGPITQSFTTWDNFPTSVRATYDGSGAVDVKTRINDIAKAYLGNTVAGLLTGAAGATGPFKIQAEYVRRTATRAVVLIAIVPAATYTGQSIFQLDDTAGGSALAQFGDFTATTCEVFLADINAKVDFLWVIDDSGSMQTSQTAVSRTGSLFGQRLTAAGLDWRAAAVTSGYYQNASGSMCSNGCTRAFTNDAALMTRWFTQGDALLFGTGGSGNEMTLGSAQKTLTSDLLPRNAAGSSNKIRDGAEVHLLVVGDQDDLSSTSGAAFLTYFQNFDSAASAVSKAVVHGITCPGGGIDCGDGSPTTPTNSKQTTVVNGTGGILADIRTFNTANPTAAQQAQQQAVVDSIIAAVINGTGHQLLKPPISSTIKIAIETGGTKGTCNTNDVPRDRVNGFDFDSASRRVVFFGNCIPSAAGKKVAVSYRYWNDASPDPNGDPCGGLCMGGKVCEPTTKSCVCPANCGGVCLNGTVCDPNSCMCGPGIN